IRRSALLGGLLLNLMPCVLPVLSIKLLSVVSYGGREAASVRFGFLATAAGIVTSMLVIAAALLGVKAAGMSVGWGIQFQQPVFLAFMALIVALFAYNLFGLFEIHLPQRLSDMSLRASDQPSAAGHFMTGAFATLLATPCSAPFVGTAVGFALSRDTLEILSVFAALGVGLALPYLAVAAFPRLATALPRPGTWMVVLRQIMGVALAATAIWLLTVIAVQIGTEGALILTAMLVLMGGVLLIQRLPGSRLGRHAGKAVFALSIAALALPVVHMPSGNAVAVAESGRWERFDQAEIARLVASGKTVFVDVTADWCITCQVNKKVVLDTQPVASWLDSQNVVAMRADWTRPNQDVANYLASFGRYGIPFNAVYGPDAPQGIALPELLTSDIVVQAAVKSDSKSQIAAR
ncbi:MAG: thioredoxin family protein, partial [Rhodospirillaceae bacterium]|nr:thioredoxin family protein [Rhodospirillaceae bacterium]